MSGVQLYERQNYQQYKNWKNVNKTKAIYEPANH